MNWENELKKNIRTIGQLKEYLDLTPEEERQIRKVIGIHPMSVTRYYLSLIDKKDKDDPIRKMIIPSGEELDLLGSYDTSGEAGSTKMPGLQHKYRQTALMLLTSRCAAYCRYCFRKRLVGLPTEEILSRFSDAVRYIEEHEEINNILITGGDPLILSTKLIERVLERLSSVSHLDFIRFGSRIPVTFPDRILADDVLLNILKKYSRKDRRIYVVTQFNHPKEVTEKSVRAVNKLINSNVIVNNQTVLLRGVNDDPEIMAQLQSKLASIGVNPYYVFQCRPVKRVKRHFQIPLAEGYRIIEEAKRKLNGPSKRFRYVMSHRTGKIEIIGIEGDKMYFKYHQARNPGNIGKFFSRQFDEEASWLDDLG